MTTLQVPPAVVRRVREGAKSRLLYILADQLTDAIEEPDEFRAVLARVEAMWGMLDALGDEDTATVEIDVRTHGVALLASVEEIMPVLHQAVADRPNEADKADELRLMQRFAAQVRRAVKA